MAGSEPWKADLRGKCLDHRRRRGLCQEPNSSDPLVYGGVWGRRLRGVVVTLGLLAYGWSGVGAASQVVGRAGKKVEL